MSSYLDTGSVLIESACETERTDAVLATLTSLIPAMQYYRCIVKHVRMLCHPIQL